MFIVITSESDLKNEITQIKQLFVLGLEILHVRKPFFSKEEMRQWLNFFPKEIHRKIVLHQHHELVGEFELKGIHLTEKKRAEIESQQPQEKSCEIPSGIFHRDKHTRHKSETYKNISTQASLFDRQASELYKSHLVSENWKRKGLTVSASFHQQKEVERQIVYDYAFLSPVFTSISKKEYEGKEYRLSKTQRPVIALGGISEKTLPLTPEMGYAGAAVLGNIWCETDPIRQFKNLQKIYEDVYG
ncbi:thiamine phosphate synthase [Galbibacter sp. EGI 63066]|uniref:thiamine phosphate synthase n=1 Tax=Galbibacter sp. EGI 63066 TaxID=2993559 RepID=UPI0022496486|nr:thiamine phosphate synthase [Galbibacter sp. EGI 63066]MCX2678867.1 thiamine phosphate synthase [Galbibacter sp. EGI 63066]